MELYQIHGVCQKRKRSHFGLTWTTYESFHDSQLLGECAAKVRLLQLQKIAACLEEKGEEAEAWLRREDLSSEICKIEALKIYPVKNGDYMKNGTRIIFEEDIRE